MALNEKRTWLIAYDIANPRRLGRVHRYIKTVAMPVQRSVYVAIETAQGIRKIYDKLAKLIHPKEDDVRIYQIPLRTRIVHYGQSPLPEGVLLAEPETVYKHWASLRSVA